ncbi:hypothetical protein GN956_G14611 [Arapaima gigas]
MSRQVKVHCGPALAPICHPPPPPPHLPPIALSSFRKGSPAGAKCRVKGTWSHPLASVGPWTLPLHPPLIKAGSLDRSADPFRSC